jgi:hypothetical protein
MQLERGATRLSPESHCQLSREWLDRYVNRCHIRSPRRRKPVRRWSCGRDVWRDVQSSVADVKLLSLADASSS